MAPSKAGALRDPVFRSSFKHGQPGFELFQPGESDRVVARSDAEQHGQR